MRGAVLHAAGDVRCEQRPDPVIIEPTDAIVRAAATCVCGSDLWPYRGIDQVPGQGRSVMNSAGSWNRSATPLP